MPGTAKSESSMYLRSTQRHNVKRLTTKARLLRVVRFVLPKFLFIAIVIILGNFIWNEIREEQVFTITKVELSGCKYTNPKTVARQVSKFKGENLFKTDIDLINETVKRNPWVRTVKTVRKIPNTLSIQVVEHMPIAIANFGSTFYLIANDGAIVDILTKGDPSFSLPIVNLSSESDNKIARQKIAAAGLLLENIRDKHPEIFNVISEVLVSDDMQVALLLNNDKNLLIVNEKDNGAAIMKYLGIFQEIKKNNPEGAIVDLRFNKQVVVKPDSRKI
ncbi:MAG: FtsQ-type POTRA domain-containing protein [Acidobacteria bacterium]|nr:FtsQ-type POTRA domain-containing protein [Acidobacteriota bacterium]